MQAVFQIALWMCLKMRKLDGVPLNCNLGNRFMDVCVRYRTRSAHPVFSLPPSSQLLISAAL